MEIRESIRDARKMSGMTITELASAAGVSYGWLAQVESGSHKPKVGRSKPLARVLDYLGLPGGEIATLCQYRLAEAMQGRSSASVARDIDMSPGYVRALRTGKLVVSAKAPVVARLAKSLQVEPESLIGGGA